VQNTIQGQRRGLHAAFHTQRTLALIATVHCHPNKDADAQGYCNSNEWALLGLI
jgi:hypothetical protein